MIQIKNKKMEKFLSSDIFRIILLIIIASLVRVYKLSGEVFRTDEANYVATAFHEGLRNLIHFIHTTEHPPFYFVIYHVWGRTFGISQQALLAFSVVSGVISVVLIYFIVKKLFKDKDLAFVSALLTCFSLFHFHFSRDATEYAFFPMMIFLSTFAFIVFIQSKPIVLHRILSGAFYVITASLLFYTHYYAFMIIIIHNLAFFIFWKKHKKIILIWIIMQLIILLLIMPELGYTYEAAHMYGKGLDQVPSVGEYIYNVKEWNSRVIYLFNIGELKTVFKAYLGKEGLARVLNKLVLLLINFIIIIGIILSIIQINQPKRIRRTKKKKGLKEFITIDKDNLLGIVLLLLLALVPIIFTAIFPAVFRTKAMMHTVLVYNTFLALGIWRISRKKAVRIALVAIFIIIGIMNIHHSIENHYFFGEEENWNGVAELLKNPENQAELIVIHVDYNMGSFLYEYNFSLVGDVVTGGYYPTNSSTSNLITVPSTYIRNITGRTVFPSLTALNSSLRDIDDLWLVSSVHAKNIYPNRDVFNLVEKDFKNVSYHRYGIVYATRYKRK